MTPDRQPHDSSPQAPDLDALMRSEAAPAPHEVHEQIAPAFERFASEIKLRTQHSQPQQSAATTRTPSRAPRFWFMAAFGLGTSAAVAALVFALLFVPTRTWAQIAERFSNLGFFHATVYLSENAEQPPEKIELWVAQNHRIRAHYRGLIFFGGDGKLTSVLDAETGEDIPLEILNARIGLNRNPAYARAYTDPHAALTLVRSIARLGETSELSLDRLLKLTRSVRNDDPLAIRSSQDERGTLQPTLNTAANMSNDMQVFDITSERAPEWMRLWVLRKSELPVRLRLWNPRDGGQLEMFFDYATEIPENAFDAANVQASIATRSGAANRLYALLSDPGGRPITPEQLHTARNGYHMPEIDAIGRTPEGVVWVLSNKAENYRADGQRLYGWERLTDNLGQYYERRTVGWLADGDTLLEYFVPLELDAGFRLPASYTLICTDRPTEDFSADAVSQPAQLIGELPITTWKNSASIPDMIKAQRNQVDGRTNWQLVAMDEAAEHKNWQQFDKLAAEIPGQPEKNPTALARDIKTAHKLFITGQRPAASLLCARLYPLIIDAVQRGADMETNIIRWHIADLYKTGQLVSARQLANTHVAEAMKRSRVEGPQFYINLLMDLRAAGMKPSEIESFFDTTNINIASINEQPAQEQTFRRTPPGSFPILERSEAP